MSLSIASIDVFSAQAGISSLSWAPDGRGFLAAFNSIDERTPLKIFELSTLQILCSFRGHHGGIYTAAFTKNGKQVVSAANDGTIRAWDSQSGKELGRTRWNPGYANGVRLSPDCRYLLFYLDHEDDCDQNLQVVDVHTGKVVRQFKRKLQDVHNPAFSPDGRQILSADDDGTIWLIDLQSRRDITFFKGHSGDVSNVVFSPDGSRFASAGYGTDDPSIRVWDVASGEELWAAVECPTGARDLCWSPGGKMLVSSDSGIASDGTVRILDGISGRQLLMFNQGTPYNNATLVSADSRIVVTGDNGGSIRTWSLVQKEVTTNVTLPTAYQCI